MQKWEYKVVKRWLDDEQLNELGQEGWELVHVADDYNYFFFKRPQN